MHTPDNPPAWLKSLPAGAIRIGVDVFNAVMKQTKDEDKARKASWAAIKAKFEKGSDGTWSAKEDVSGVRKSVIHFRASQADAEGLVWEAVLIEPGLSLGYPRFYWSEEVLAAAVEVFQGVDINAYELTAEFFSHLPIPDVAALEDVKRYLTAKKVGWVEKAWWEAGIGIKATICFLPEQRWLPNMLLQGMQAGNDKVLGLSIDSRIRGVEVVVEDWTVIWVTKIMSASSVDVVTRPAAGGKFLRAVAGLYEEGNAMDKAKLLDLIKKHRPGLLEGKDVAALGDAEIVTLVQMAIKTAEKPGAGAGASATSTGQASIIGTEFADDLRAALGLPPAGSTTGITPEVMNQEIAKAVEAVEMRAACGRMLDSTLAVTDLPKIAADRIRGEFDGKTFKAEELQAAIKRERDYLAAMATFEGGPSPWGDQSRTSGGLGQRDKVEMAMDLVFGLTTAEITSLGALRRLDGKRTFEGMRAAQDYDVMAGIKLPSGLRELYTMLTGDPEVTGQFNRKLLPGDLRAAQDITSTTFSFVVGNTLARRMVADYLATNFREDLLISIRKPAKDFRPQEAVMVGYFPDLALVDPEAADYTEIAPVTDEEAAYTVLQYGNLLTITRKMILNDDLSVIQRLVSRLGRAARRTHAKYVWTMFVANTNCTDGTAWFTAPHGNLAANLLTFANAITGYQALAAMTEKDSGEIIGLLDDQSVKPTLVYPVALMATAESIVKDEFYFTANDLTTKTRNPLYGKIGGAQISLLTDANDWGLLMPPNVMDMVEMSYLNGRTEPEMFLADSPQAEQVFVADKIRHKIRHEYAGHVIDFRSGYKGENV